MQDDSELEDYSAPEVGHLVLPERVPIQVGVPQGDAPGAQVRQQENLHHNLNHNLASGKKKTFYGEILKIWSLLCVPI